MLSVIMEIFLFVVILCIVMLSVIMLNTTMLSVVVLFLNIFPQHKCPKKFYNIDLMLLRKTCFIQTTGACTIILLRP